MSISKARQVILSRKIKIPLPNSLQWFIWYVIISWHSLLFSLEHHRLLWLTFSSQLKRLISLKDRLWVLRRMLKLWGQYRCIQNSLTPDEVIIMDGGLLYFAVALFTSENESPNHKLVKNYINSIPKPNLLILVNTPIEVCIGRVLVRERELPRRLQQLTPKAIKAYITHQAEAVDVASSNALNCSWQILQTENHMPLPQVIKELRQARIWKEIGFDESISSTNK
jgi:hypothetical protein